MNVEDQAWTLNPLCVEPVPETETTETLNESSEELRSEFRIRSCSFLKMQTDAF